MGKAILKYVRQEHHEIIAIDSSQKVITETIDAFDVMGVCGSGISYETLKTAGVEKADFFIAVTASDEANMLACMIANKMGAKKTIARVREVEFTKQIELMRGALGITKTINPEYESAKEILRIINFPEALKVESFAHGNADITEFYITPTSPLVGMSLMQINSKLGTQILVCAVKRGDEVIIPNGSFVFKGGERISVISSQKESKAFVNKLGLSTTKIKNVLIIGASKIAHYLTQVLLKDKIGIKVIEINKDKAKEFAEANKDATVIVGDGADQVLLQQEGFKNFDAVVCLTGIDEENIIISLYASKQEIKKTITKVNKASFASLLESIQMGSVIYPQDIAANKIVSDIRSSANKRGNNIVTLYKIVENQVEVSEFIASHTSKVLNIALKDLRLKHNVLIGGIIRDNQVIIPSGMTMINEEDSVIIVTKDIILNDLDDILE